jgi:hypothetical protein
MNKYIHNIILAIIIGFFIWILLLYSNIVQESFLGASAAMQAAQDAKKNIILQRVRPGNLQKIYESNDANYLQTEKGTPIYVQLTTVPYGQATNSIQIGLVKDTNVDRNIPDLREIPNVEEIMTPIIGMKVPQGYKVSVFAGINFTGASNTITGEKTIDDFKYAATMFDNEEEEDENGNPIVWEGNKVGWEQRIKSIKIHRSVGDPPEDFDGKFYNRVVNYYNYLKKIELSKPIEQQKLDNIGEIAYNMQWQYFVDKGEKAGHQIYEGSGPYRIENNSLTEDGKADDKNNQDDIEEVDFNF